MSKVEICFWLFSQLCDLSFSKYHRVHWFWSGCLMEKSMGISKSFSFFSPFFSTYTHITARSRKSTLDIIANRFFFYFRHYLTIWQFIKLWDDGTLLLTLRAFYSRSTDINKHYCETLSKQCKEDINTSFSTEFVVILYAELQVCKIWKYRLRFRHKRLLQWKLS